MDYWIDNLINWGLIISRGSAELQANSPLCIGGAFLKLLPRIVLHLDDFEEALVKDEPTVLRVERHRCCVLQAGSMGTRVEGRPIVLSLLSCPAHSADDDLRISYRMESAYLTLADQFLRRAVWIHTLECLELMGLPRARAHVLLRFVVLISHT